MHVKTTQIQNMLLRSNIPKLEQKSEDTKDNFKFENGIIHYYP